jgi:sugar/nucleoside kinase (ribokinase family)
VDGRDSNDAGARLESDAGGTRIIPHNAKSPSLLIIGGASLDLLRFAGRAERSIGGAGLYTSLAARRAGARVTMFAPRPNPMPVEFLPVAERIDWIGPIVAPDDLPSFEIAHYGSGKAELVNARWGSESLLTPANLPDNELRADIVYCGPLADPARQLAFLQYFKARGYRTAVGTYGRAVMNFRDVVRQTFEQADIFFCNTNEATLLFGGVESATTAAGKLFFITRSADGAVVVQGDYQTRVPSIAVGELDPTGAGDTFCGTTLTLLAQGVHPVLAAQQATVCAAEMVTAVGPTMLLKPPPLPAIPTDHRVEIIDAQIERIAALIARLDVVKPFDFVGADFPRVGDPHALDYFFASTLQQFCFWLDDGTRYTEPFAASLDGRTLKGSDFLWAAYRRWLDADVNELTPAGQARISREELARCYTADDRAQMPMIDKHLRCAQNYGRDMLALGWTPAEIVSRSNASDKPLSALLAQMDCIGGYKEDPLRKKSVLLAIILQQRPEQFLRADADEIVPPIIDYHLQRSCMRMGLIDVTDPRLRQSLVNRELLAESDEWIVRRCAHAAIERLVRASGKSMGAVDWFFFSARRRCPEMVEPDCTRCAADPACAHRKELFQPVRRTTFY